MSADFIEKQYEKQKETHGGWATFAWIGSGIYLFATADGARFLSWQAAVFFIVGMFASPVVFGIAAYLIQRGVAKILVRTISTPSAGVAAVVRAIGLALFVAETVVIFLIARWIVISILLVGAPAIAGDKPMEYQDNQYQFAFLFPQDWKLEKAPPGNEYGEMRVIVRHPTLPIYAMAAVAQLGKAATKEQYDANPKRDEIVNAMMLFTVEEIYKKVSREIGADRMIVAEKRVVPSDVGMEFYISTVQMKGDMPIGVFGLHAVPFGRPYIVSFIMVSPVDKTATADNETTTKVFNSFHLLGEKPVE